MRIAIVLPAGRANARAGATGATAATDGAIGSIGAIGTTGTTGAIVTTVQALVQAAARHGTGHTLLLLLPRGENGDADADVEQAVALRHALAPLLGARGTLQLHAFEAPRGADPWRRQATGLLRATMLQDLGADVVWMPGHAAMLAPAAGAGAGVGAGAGAGAESEAVADATIPGIPVVYHHAAPDLSPAAADALLATLLAAAAGKAQPSVAATAVRPRLAYLSPLPPQQSGIADYSVELLDQLAHYYDIELIVDSPPAPALASRFPVRDVAWFDRHADRYDRRLYHFGNNRLHGHLFGLLQRHPGVVVLHDFYLSAVLDKMEIEGCQPDAWLHAMYASHGYSGLLAARRMGRNPALWAYPCNKPVLDHATGVIVHAEFSRRLAQHWYGGDCGADWRVVPLIRGLPASAAGNAAGTTARSPAPGSPRHAARSELGLADDAFVVCSFGMMGVTKRNDVLLDAFLSSPLATDPRCQLVFVGAHALEEYGRDMAARIAASGIAANLRITGYVSGERYAAWLAAADLAVQLRSHTRGETSAAVLDCLLYGVPTVVDAHGANADLPPDVVVMLDDGCDADALGAALTRLHGDAAGPDRAALATRARTWMAARHAPAQAGPRMRDAIEAIAAASPASHYARLQQALRRLQQHQPAPAGALMETAAAIVANRLPAAPRQLLVDISALVQADLKTGIQRVVRSVLLGLIEAPPPGMRVEPVYSDGNGRPYRYARTATFRLLGLVLPARDPAPESHATAQDDPFDPLEDAPVDARAGDLFLGLDLFTTGTEQNHAVLQAMRRRGVQVHFVVYDLLPVMRPDLFPVGASTYFAAYLDTIAAVSDGLACISRAVADELHHWLAARPPRRTTPLPLGYFHLGADLGASAPSTGLPAHADQVLAAVAARPTVLMVGTLEPRKGHAQALAAFDLLWRQGTDVNLVVVGKLGWMVDAVAQQLRTHAERDRRLFWLAGASDEMLDRLYGASSALLAASVGEGFGLPLVEAARHGLPIIARDLPVFREVGGDHAHYFTGADAAALAASVQQWLALHADGRAPPSTALPWLTWQDSVAQLQDVLAGRRWHRTVAAPPSAAGAKP